MSIDIVNLIENTPIDILTGGDYQSKLIEKVLKNFSSYEQQLFFSNFYCYLNHDAKTDFVVDLDNIWRWLGFSNKANSKFALEKNFTIDKDYKTSRRADAPQQKTGEPLVKSDTRGGHNKEMIMLNIETFKKFCLKAGTKKADEIHEYYIKMVDVLHETMQEECEDLKMQIQQKTEEIAQIDYVKNKEYEQKLAEERQKILLREFGRAGSLIYICKIKTRENGEYVIKIGESRIGVLARFKQHKTNYDECLLLDCFLVNRSKGFESFLHEHESIIDSRVNDLPGHENERELFLIGKKLSYETILKIISDNLKRFDDNGFYEIEKLQLEIERLKLSQTQTNLLDNPTLQQGIDGNTLLQQAIDKNALILRKMDALEQSNKEVLSKLNAAQTKVTTGFNEPLVTLGPRLQCINPETLQLVKVYESVSECMSENSAIKRPSINKAIAENTIYHGFRWLLVERHLDPMIITNLSATKIIQTQNVGYVAKLNQSKTEILNVYLDRKTAAIANGYASISALDNPVNNSTLTNGNYYALYESCEEALKDEFIQKNENKPPLLYKNGVGQYDQSGVLVREFSCKYECIRTLHISDKTLEKALTKNVLYNDHHYKYLGAKIKCFDI